MLSKSYAPSIVYTVVGHVLYEALDQLFSRNVERRNEKFVVDLVVEDGFLEKKCYPFQSSPK